jgi:hypothetical protein
VKMVGVELMSDAHLSRHWSELALAKTESQNRVS